MTTNLTTVAPDAVNELFETTNANVTVDNIANTALFYEQALDAFGIDTTVDAFRAFIDKVGTLAAAQPDVSSQEATRRLVFTAASKYGKIMTARGYK